MVGLPLKSIQFGITEKSIVIRVVHAKDSRQGLLALHRQATGSQIVQGWRQRVENGLLGLEKDVIDAQQILGAAFDTLSDKREPLHECHNLLSTSRQGLFVGLSRSTAGTKEVHFVLGDNDGNLYVSCRVKWQK